MLRGLLLPLGVGLALSLGATATTAAPARFVAFKTPSGNIGCIYSDGPHYLRCDLRTFFFTRPRRPAGCQEEYGDSVSMNRTGRAHFVCHGDTALEPSARVVAYGTSLTVGPYRCTSRTTGLTCTNASGHGWFLSRQSYRLF